MTPSTPLKKLDNSHADENGVEDETMMMDTNLDVAEGNGVDLICGASGKPEPTIKWLVFDYETSNSIYLQSKILIDFP
jgi:hypothetical protein